jgi:hypothetical protein
VAKLATQDGEDPELVPMNPSRTRPQELRALNRRTRKALVARRMRAEHKSFLDTLKGEAESLRLRIEDLRVRRDAGAVARDMLLQMQRALSRERAELLQKWLAGTALGSRIEQAEQRQWQLELDRASRLANEDEERREELPPCEMDDEQSSARIFADAIDEEEDDRRLFAAAMVAASRAKARSFEHQSKQCTSPGPIQPAGHDPPGPTTIRSVLTSLDQHSIEPSHTTALGEQLDPDAPEVDEQVLPPSGTPEGIKYACNFQGCGLEYATIDAVRKHCKGKHPEWMKNRLGRWGPQLYWTPKGGWVSTCRGVMSEGGDASRCAGAMLSAAPLAQEPLSRDYTELHDCTGLQRPHKDALQHALCDTSAQAVIGDSSAQAVLGYESSGLVEERCSQSLQQALMHGNQPLAAGDDDAVLRPPPGTTISERCGASGMANSVATIAAARAAVSIAARATAQVAITAAASATAAAASNLGGVAIVYLTAAKRAAAAANALAAVAASSAACTVGAAPPGTVAPPPAAWHARHEPSLVPGLPGLPPMPPKPLPQQHEDDGEEEDVRCDIELGAAHGQPFGTLYEEVD